MKRAKTILAWVSLAAMPCAMAQQGGRDAFVQQQAYAEMQRVSGQIDVLQGNVDDLAATVRRLERANAAGDTESLRSRMAALEASVAALRRDLQSQRAEIVKEISARIAKMLHDRPAPQPQKSEPAFTGSYREYTVVAGDTLSIIAQAFKTTVARLKEMNSLKSDVLRVGQVLKVPADK